MNVFLWIVAVVTGLTVLALNYFEEPSGVMGFTLGVFAAAVYRLGAGADR